ncbi:MAG: hypothetical protein HY275_11350 [Gemmatimonadetes bacterium]|nr:hypothetical protein [Gemmatimonadota bacterium]
MHQPLQVVGYVATRKDDAERGPKVWMRGDDAAARMLQDGELVWIYGPRRQQLAPLAIDDALPRGGVVVRDVVGVAVTELVRIRKPDFDRAEDRRKYV